MNLRTFLFYLATWSLVALTPGPAAMCAMAQATRHGFRSSLAGIAGIQIGNLLFFAFIAFGLASLLATATTAFTILRVVGAAYLLYLGVRLLASSIRRPPAQPVRSPVPPVARHSLLLQGLLIQLTNPKALLFVSALLPQFIEPDRPVLSQLVVLLVVTVTVDTAVLSSYALFAGRSARAFQNSRVSAWPERVFGAVLLGFGFRLLLSRK